MFLTETRTGELVEVLSTSDLFDPFKTRSSVASTPEKNCPSRVSLTKPS